MRFGAGASRFSSCASPSNGDGRDGSPTMRFQWNPRERHGHGARIDVPGFQEGVMLASPHRSPSARSRPIRTPEVPMPTPKRISGRDHPEFRRFLAVKSRKNRDLILVEGPKLLREALRSHLQRGRHRAGRGGGRCSGPRGSKGPLQPRAHEESLRSGDTSGPDGPGGATWPGPGLAGCARSVRPAPRRGSGSGQRGHALPHRRGGRSVRHPDDAWLRRPAVPQGACGPPRARPSGCLMQATSPWPRRWICSLRGSPSRPR